MKSIEQAAKEAFQKISVNGMREITESRAIEIFKAGALFMQQYYPVSEFDFEKYDSEYVLLKDSEKSIPVIKQVLCNEDLTDFILYRPIEII